MGGGDLNLKKSWHPSTLRNIERVWKAEQKHTAEQKKIEELQKELQDERGREEMRQFAEDKGVIGKKSDRLDWMYAGPAAMVDRSEYLLGRQVDKTFEVMDLHSQGLMNDNANDASQPGAIFNSGNINVTVDLANKVKEDPLFAIKKKEMQAKKDILRNPVKMKQLQKYLEETTRKAHKKKSKKSKKKHSKSSSSSDNEESEVRERRKSKKSKHKHRKKDDLDIDNESKYREKDSRIHNHKFVGERSYFSRDDGTRSKNHEKHHKVKGSDKEYSHRSRSRHESSSENEQRRDEIKSSKDDPGKRSRKREAESSDDDVKPRKFGLIGGHKNRGDSPPGRIDYRKIKVTTPQVKKQEPRRKMDAEEMERRRLEMMDNAKWRDDQRSKNVQRYREESNREIENHSKSNGAKFIAPMLAKAVDSGSVEARIKQNKYKIQRSGVELNKNFAKR